MADCFVCTGPRNIAMDRPDNWLAPRYACPAHAKQVVLPTGETLVSFLGRRKPANYPLEGSGLNWVINPGRIGDFQVWLDFHFAWPAVIEEIFPSHSYFDFIAQHLPQHVTLLHAFWDETRRNPNAPRIQRLMSSLARLESGGKTFSALSGIWERQVAWNAAFAHRGYKFVESPEDAETMAHALGSSSPARFGALNAASPPRSSKANPVIDEFTDKLMELAAGRYKHLEQGEKAPTI